VIETSHSLRFPSRERCIDSKKKVIKDIQYMSGGLGGLLDVGVELP